MIWQMIKAIGIFISFIFFVLGVFQFRYDINSYIGFIGASFFVLWAVNVISLIDSWQSERRKFDLGIDEREYDRQMTRWAD